MSWRSFPVTALSFALLGALILLVGGKAEADNREAAQQLVAEALHREIYGLQSDRNRLLAEAIAVDPNYAPARWHQGFVRVGAQWSHVYDAPGIMGTSSTLASYRKLREDARAGGHRLADPTRGLLPLAGSER